MDTATVLGMIGVSGILGAYFLNLFNLIDQNSYPYFHDQDICQAF